MSTYQKIKTPKGMPPMPPSWLMKLMFAVNMTPPPPEPYFTKPDNWDKLQPEERRELRLDN